ncbi:4-hydroxyphenylpyruvate dioxygenase [Duganella sp. SG902]|uniref:VOC family protein n=1 Tax=Duganella sp. SG902 TaxID=2587016 RepID=UPI00159DE60D|nr:VOC family protein [Duganella sp. SG902]NVM74382.1 4-hydroxyphenylpyruvate dioxygenase [Duganella sp. SG902]
MKTQENNPLPSNPLGLDGIEFVEYATSEPLALGAVLETMGFVQVGRHRSREVVLYRQGGMNIVVNADPVAWAVADADRGTTTLSAIAFRVRDAGAAYQHALARGAWAIPTRAGAMELNIPGVHGAGDSVLYFVDRYQDFSIYDVDFKISEQPLPKPVVPDMGFFGVVQAIRRDRTAQWIDFYQHLMSFRVVPQGVVQGVLPSGTLLESPCKRFYLQLIEPPAGSDDGHWDEELIRVGFGTRDVMGAVRTLQERGVTFVDRPPVQPCEKGALTQLFKGSVSFELVHSEGV